MILERIDYEDLVLVPLKNWTVIYQHHSYGIDKTIVAVYQRNILVLYSCASVSLHRKGTLSDTDLFSFQ